MAADAIRTLRHVRDGHGDQLLCLRGNRPFGEHALAEGSEGLGRSGGETVPLFGNLPSCVRIDLFVF